MSGLLPTETDAGTEQDGELRTLWLDSDDAGDLLSSLSSETARSILTALHEEPATASQLADRVGTSLQNVRHHLANLQDAGAVRVADVRYSEKGREMKVYAPATEPLVVFVGREESRPGFVASLERFLGAVGVLALASLLVQLTVGTATLATGPGSLPRMPDAVGGVGGIAPLSLPPGALFFAGGALVLALAAIVRWRGW